MPVKKNSSNAKKSKNVPAGKRHQKLTMPKGEKVSSMKGTDFSITKHIDKGSPVLFL
jgi:type VI protein secretion system component Hcp